MHDSRPSAAGASPRTLATQGHDQLQRGSSSYTHTTEDAARLATNGDRPTTPPLPASISTTVSPTGTPRLREGHFNPDASSPTRLHSPLRQSISYADHHELPVSEARPQSPTDHWIERPESVDMPYAGESRYAGSVGGSPRNRAPGWFTRASTPGTDGDDTTPTKSYRSQPGSESNTPKNPSPAGASRFAFWSSPITAFKGMTQSPATAARDDDGLINLDIETALFPAGSTSDRDTFSPAAFKNLQMTATGLLHKYQNAYRQQSKEILELKAEREAQADEKDETETRAQHLKMQLEGMARKAAAHEASMRELMQELANERRMGLQERTPKEKGDSAPEGLAPSEDLGAEEDQRKRRWRKSGGTAKSDMSFDTDEESMEDASVFSRSRSPTIAASLSETSPIENPIIQSRLLTSAPPRSSRTTQPQMSTFQKLFKNTPNEPLKDIDEASSTGGCQNCQGQEASVAWDTVSLLRDENKGLKHRVGELEMAVDGALDAVIGIRL